MESDIEYSITIKYPAGSTVLHLPRALDAFSVKDWKKFFKLILRNFENDDVADLLDRYLPELDERYDGDQQKGHMAKEHMALLNQTWREMRQKG